MEWFREAGLKLKPKRCKFVQSEVQYLGHIVSINGIRTDLKNLEAVKQYPLPTDLETLCSYLGLGAYYRWFVPGFFQVVAPLYALTKYEALFWAPECQAVFKELKHLLTSSPVLVYPDFGKPFTFEMSGGGLGAVLSQCQSDNSVRPIAYVSRLLQPHENYSITELEGLCMVWAAKHFRLYLYGHPCKLYMDNEAL